MKRFYLYILLLLAINSVFSCQKSSGTIQTQAFVDSIFIKNGLLDATKSDICYYGLKGNIKSLSLKFEGDGGYFPLDNFVFDNSGNISQIEYVDWGGETVRPYQISKKEENRILEIEGELFFAQFDMINNPKQATISIYDQEGGETKYSLKHDNYGNLKEIEVYNEWWYDYEAKDRRTESEVCKGDILHDRVE